MYYTLDKPQKRTEVINILSSYVDEVNLTDVIIKYVGTERVCEVCYDFLGNEWKKLPCCKIFIHKKCFTSKCSKCNDQIISLNTFRLDKTNWGHV